MSRPLHPHVVMSIRVPIDLGIRMEALCNETGATFAETIRKALDEYLRLRGYPAQGDQK